jgi:polyribonucleotide nucleotidyltransferase
VNSQVGQQTLSIETGKLAKQADGSVIVRSATRWCSSRPATRRRARASTSCPLTVDYREYTYASGRIPGGFFKREGKPPRRKC